MSNGDSVTSKRQRATVHYPPQSVLNMQQHLIAFVLLAVTLLTSGCGNRVEEDPDRVTIDTGLGTITGLHHNGVLQFLGIRYAKAPVGDLRFMPPVAAGGWSEPLDATTYGSWCPQQGLLAAAIGAVDMPMSEDCLVLNIVTPVQDGTRPVLFWIHGGGHQEGSANDYDGSRLAAQGDVVVVTINYRLGLLGYAGISSLGEQYAGAESNGYRDQILALEWVRDHIADYGGDPDNVTIFGESAGGHSVLAMLASPSADGLYHKAIAHSPGDIVSPPEDRAPALAAALGVSTDELGTTLRDLPVEKLNEVRDLGMTGGTVDGVVVTRSKSAAIADRGAAGVPLIAGSNRDEGTLFAALIPEAAHGQFTAVAAGMVTGGSDPRPYLAAVHAAHPDDESARFEQIWSDAFLVVSVGAAQRATEAGPGGWLYRFDMESTVPFLGKQLGATHAAEIVFTFNAVGDDFALNLYDGDDPDVRSLAERWSNTIIAFARTGNPNGAGLPEWPRYSAEDRRTLVLDANSRVEADFERDRLNLWKSVGITP